MNALNVIAAKSDRDDHTKWLSFLTHSKDTAGIMQKLYQKWLPQQVRNNLSRSISAQTSLQTAEMHTGKLCRLIAFLHDIGKVTPAFQLRITDSIENHREMMRCAGLELGHIKEPNKSPHPLAGQAILEDFGFPREITSIVGAHHGKGDVYKSLDQICTYPSNYYGEKRRQKSEWRSLWKEWIDYTLSETGFSIDTLPHPDIKSQMILTGILIMADWIASNTDLFPLISIDDDGDEPRRHGGDRFARLAHGSRVDLHKAERDHADHRDVDCPGLIDRDAVQRLCLRLRRRGPPPSVRRLVRVRRDRPAAPEAQRTGNLPLAAQILHLPQRQAPFRRLLFDTDIGIVHRIAPFLRLCEVLYAPRRENARFFPAGV